MDPHDNQYIHVVQPPIQLKNSVAKDIRRAPNQKQVDPHDNQHVLYPQNIILGPTPQYKIKKRPHYQGSEVCVGITYLPGQSPAKYCRRT